MLVLIVIACARGQPQPPTCSLANNERPRSGRPDRRRPRGFAVERACCQRRCRQERFKPLRQHVGEELARLPAVGGDIPLSAATGLLSVWSRTRLSASSLGIKPISSVVRPKTMRSSGINWQCYSKRAVSRRAGDRGAEVMDRCPPGNSSMGADRVNYGSSTTIRMLPAASGQLSALRDVDTVTLSLVSDRASARVRILQDRQSTILHHRLVGLVKWSERIQAGKVPCSLRPGRLIRPLLLPHDSHHVFQSTEDGSLICQGGCVAHPALARCLENGRGGAVAEMYLQFDR